MFVDGRQVPEGTEIETDLAIIGGGAAGITIAREFAGTGVRVALIESGGFDFDADTQALYEGEIGGVDYTLDGSRLRYFGGSTNHWGGWCRPLEKEDFEKRDWVPHSGWPITRGDLDPYYPRAAEICQLHSTNFDDPKGWKTDKPVEPLPLAGDEVMTRFFIYSPPTRFGEVYRPDIKKAENVTCYLNSNVLEILPTENAAEVDHLRVATLQGNGFTVRPKTVVLATGGIENARMLLLSNSIAKAGLGNQNDLVGRYFMEHPHIPYPADILITDEKLVPAFYRTYTPVEKAVMRGCFMFTPEYLARTGRLGTVMTFYPREEVKTAYTPSKDGDVTPEKKAEREAAHKLDAGILQAIRSSTALPAKNDTLGWRFGIGCASEQHPNPDSRITLSDEKDALGLQRTKLTWRLKGTDATSLHQNVRALARAWGGWGEGRIRIIFQDREEWTEAEGWGNHHMGSTRMAADARQGVCDADCRVHGMSNLYIAGSSVYPTTGTVNPTLTLVALAVRMADHLKTRFANSMPGETL